MSWTRRTNERHTLAIVRANGSVEKVDLETRSCLLHDFVHWAVEHRAGFDGGFFGSLASGMTLHQLNDRDSPPTDPELMRVERIVGPVQSLVRRRGSISAFVDIIDDPVVDAAFVEAVLKDVRHIEGRWGATPFKRPLTLAWTRASRAEPVAGVDVGHTP